MLDFYNNGYKPFTLTEIQNPSKLVFIGDTAYVTVDGGTRSLMITAPFLFYSKSDGKTGNYDNPASGYVSETRALKHNGGANFCMADGHAKYYKKN